VFERLGANPPRNLFARRARALEEELAQDLACSPVARPVFADLADQETDAQTKKIVGLLTTGQDLTERKTGSQS
jgi:hypothetical protein